MTNYRLPPADFVISDVGTNIYDLRNNRQWQVWRQWQAEIAPDWKDHDHADLQQLLSGFRALRLQQHSKQNTFKLSYYFALHENQGRLHRELQEILQGAGVRASLIWSVDEPAGIGLLDITPERATKLHAVQFLRKSLGIVLEDTLFAGDSGNDLPILVSDVPSVLVANATPSMAKEAQRAAQQLGHDDSLYLARGGFLGMNGNYSAGILEGVAHFHPELLPLFEPMPTRAGAGPVA